MTIKDIAKHLNVSISTVSKALNGSTDIGDDTKRLICDYAEKIGYRSRRSMSLSGKVAIIWAKEEQDVKFSSLSQVAEAFYKVATANRYDVLEIVLKQKDYEKFKLNSFMEENHLSGAFIFNLNFLTPIYSQLKSTKYPLILMDNYIAGNELISGVGSDNIMSTQKAVDYLVSLGHKRIAFLGGERQSLAGAERLAGYILGLSKNGIEYRYELTYFGDFSRQSGIDAANYFISQDFSAVICASDMMAMGLIDRLSELGAAVPSKVSVMGFDDLEVLRFTKYGLTTVRQDFDLIGEKAFRILDSMIKGLPAQRATIGCQLITRDSTRRIN